MHAFLRRLALAALALGLSALPAHAQKPKKAAKPPAPEPVAAAPAPPPGPKPLSETLTDQAKVDYESGKLLYGDGDFAGARVKFQAAHEASKDPRLLWNMAVCEKNLRHYARVMDLAQRYLDQAGSLLSEADRTEAQELIAAIEAFTVSLTLTVNESGAELWIDGERAGTSPLEKPLTVDIGAREIEAKKPGFVPFRSSVPVGGQKQASFDIKLVRELHEGQLSVAAARGASITIDGKRVGDGQWTGKLSSGGHTLRVEAKGMRAYQSEVVIQDGEKRAVEVVLEPIPVAAPAPERHGPLYDLELGFRTGYGIAQTSAQPLGQQDNQHMSVPFIPLWLDIGYRLGRPTYLGLYLQYGWLSKSETCGVARHGAEPSGEQDSSVRYGYKDCRLLKAGIDVVFHIMPRTIIDPYFGFDVGVQGTFARYRSYDPTTGTSSEGGDNNASIQPGFQLGFDVHPVSTLGVGLFAHAAPHFGSEGKPNSDGADSPNTCPAGSLNCQPTGGCQNGSCDSDAKVGSHILFGTRVAYTFP